MRKIAVLVSIILISNGLFAQKDFIFSTKHKNSITSVYYTFIGKDYTTQYRYGLYDENKQKVVLPMQYTKIWNSNDDDIFILEDTTKKWSLYAVKTNTFILKSEYSEIKPFADGLAIVAKMQDGKTLYGAIDKTGKLVVPIQYKYLGNASEGLLCFSRDKGYGFIDKNNKEVIAPMYRSAVAFKSGLACVSLLDSTYYGYIDKKNNWVVKPKYLRGGDFKDNYAVVFTTRNYTLSSDNAGVIDKTGKEIIPLKYDNITVEDNFFIVKEIRKESYLTVTRYGVLDLTGKVLLPIEYSSINKKYGIDYYEVTKNSKSSLIDKNAKFSTLGEFDYLYTYTDFGVSHVRTDKKYTVIDKTLKAIIPERGANNVILGRKNKIALLFNDKVEIYNETGKLLKTIKEDNVTLYGTEFYSNDDSLKLKYSKRVYMYDIATQKKELLNYSEVSDFNEEGIFAAKNTNYDFVDYTGKKLSTKSYYSVVNFTEDIAAVQESMYSTPYLVDKSFTKIKDLSNVFEGPFSEGLAKAKASYGSTRYFYDKKGTVAITLSSASETGNFKNGRASVKQQYGNKFYFIDKTGKKINNEEYDEVGAFSEYLAGVKKDGKAGYIDTTGKWIIPNKFDVGSPFYNGVAIVKDGNEYYQINKKGDKLNRDVYNGAGNPANGYYPVQKGTTFGLIDESGKTIVDFKYQDITPLYEGVAWAKKEGKWGLVSANNKAITGFEYDGGDNCKNGYIKVIKDKKSGLLDKSGKQILPVQYDQMGTAYKGRILLVVNEGTERMSLK
jgi:hypothetical protein